METPTGTIALKKTSEDGVVAGISFHIKGDGFDKTVKTDANGNLTVEGLFPATYPEYCRDLPTPKQHTDNVR